MKTAYEKWLIMQVEHNDKPITALANILYCECYKGNPMAFELVDKVGDTGWAMITFHQAAKLILSEE